MLCGAGDPTQHIIGKYYTTELHFQSFKYILELAYQYFFFVTRGIKLRASGLRGKYSPTWATPPALLPFCFYFVFRWGSHIFAWGGLELIIFLFPLPE
jgi:hypothetical protein